MQLGILCYTGTIPLLCKGSNRYLFSSPCQSVPDYAVAGSRGAALQRSKDLKLEELTMVREHENACHKLKHQLELGLKRDKVAELTA